VRYLFVAPVWLCLAAAAAAEPPPVSAFTNYAQYQTVALSPNGTLLAITRRTPEGEELMVLKLPDLAVSTHGTLGKLIDIERVEWANEGRLLLQPMRRFLGFTAYKVPTGEIMGIDADGSNLEILLGYDAGQTETGTRLRVRTSIDQPARMLRALPDDPNNVLIQTFGYGIKGDFNYAYRMDVRSGLVTRLASSPIRDGSFVFDLDNKPAFVYGADDNGFDAIYYRPSDSNTWKEISPDNQNGGEITPAGPWTATEFLVLDNRDAPTKGVFAYSPADGSSRLLFRNPDVDVTEWRTDPTGKPWMFIYDDHLRRYWYPDPEHPLAQVHQWLLSTFAGHSVDIHSTTSDMSYVIAEVSSPRVPLVFFYVDAKNKKLLKTLEAYPELKESDLADVDPIEIVARDGLKVRGYLTVPNVPVKKNLPMIVFVHGGPYDVYDRWGFDPEAQLFASRGYAVLQVNFRGSDGRGREFERAGYGKWGTAMQDDVTDAVKWAIGDGIADRKRICIYGASYGAYAALTGVFREPDLFRCAVGMAGVYDLPLMFEKGDIKTAGARVLNPLRIAVGTDTEELKRRSPVYNADKIHAAVMLLHGRDDERAPLEHARRMRAALRKAGNPPEWLVEAQEAHGFFDEGDRLLAYERMLAFFAKHLAVAPPSTP
jgi:dipeptidyl aminopeptidase/acylaminoacyl peptidase